MVKKRHEILQMELLKPKVAILDETDSGLDVDALKVVAEGVNRARRPTTSGCCSSRTTRGSCATSSPTTFTSSSTAGSSRRAAPRLADRLEEEGYDRYAPAAAAADA